MKIRSILLSSVSVIFLLLVTGCFMKWNKKDDILVKSSNQTVATYNDFKEMISVLEKSESGLQFISLLPVEEQEKIYLKLIEEYLISNFLIKKYLEENKISSEKKYQEEYKQYIKIMENNFNSAVFQKTLNDLILIDDEIARNYYLSNRENEAEFMNPPFASKAQGFEIRAVRIEEGKNLNDYKDRLKNNKDVIYLERINASMRGTSQILIEALKVMNNGDFKEVTIENGMKFAVLKINDHKGEWAEYKDVSDKVKTTLRTKMLQQKYEESISDLKEKYKVEINMESIKKYIKDSVASKEEPTEKDLENAVDKISESIATMEAKKVEDNIIKDLKEEVKQNIDEIAVSAIENSQDIENSEAL